MTPAPPAVTSSTCSGCDGQGLVLIGRHISICSSCGGKGYRRLRGPSTPAVDADLQPDVPVVKP